MPATEIPKRVKRSLKNLSVLPMRIGTDELKRAKTETSSLQS